jgi:hypothetical protein
MALISLVIPALSRYPVNPGAINFRRSKYLAPMLDPGSPDGVRDDDKYVRLVFTNRRSISQACVANAYINIPPPPRHTGFKPVSA